MRSNGDRKALTCLQRAIAKHVLCLAFAGGRRGLCKAAKQWPHSTGLSADNQSTNQSINQLHLSSTMAGCVQGDRVFLSSKPLYPEPALPKSADWHGELTTCAVQGRETGWV